jgi:hypothetical protein
MGRCSLTYVYAQIDYRDYHRNVMIIEEHIANENYVQALKDYGMLFEDYPFVFKRDYQIASQLAIYLGNDEKSIEYLRHGIAAGWTLKSIKKNKFLDEVRKGDDWKTIAQEYDSLYESYESRLNQDVRNRVKEMFSKDQWKALGALFTFSSDAQDRYAEKKFAPHSEPQVREFLDIQKEYGYPGERLVGNDYWMSTILSHHNSISQSYNRQDTLYISIKPLLLEALIKGEMSAFEFALIDEWYRASVDYPNLPTYGILDGPKREDLSKVNALRATVFIRSIEVHNRLVEVEKDTGMNFYLEGHPWEAGTIPVYNE